MAGLGLRLALEAGAHRRRRPVSGNVLDTEMWKRAFWWVVFVFEYRSMMLIADARGC
jgi:hypothetical protein